MVRRSRRARIAVRIETLEPRTMLSASGTGTFVGPLPSAPTTVLVRFAANTPVMQVRADLASVHGFVVQAFPNGPSVVELAAGVDLATALRKLSAEPQVVYADANAEIHAASLYPNDPLFNEQWGLNNPNSVDIDAPEAWSITTGNSATIVAVLDTGIDITNPEFAGRIWTNPNQFGDSGTPGDLHGWNYVSNTPNILDNNGHGTHVAGILAANGNNGVAVAGVDWHAQILPVKVLDQFGNGSTSSAVSGIYFAVNHGARVINASWGGGAYSQAMIDAINYANSHGVVFVTAAGNDGTDNDNIPSYPASYRLPNEIAVAAIDQNGNLASFSNFGAQTVDLAAPGVNIVSTIPGSTAVYSGTSMATPYVAGVVSLLVGLHPQYSAAQLVHQVLANTKPLPSLSGMTVTGGMVDAYAALTGRSVSASGSAIVPNGSTDAAVQAALATFGQQSNSGFVNLLYHVFLERAPDPGGFSGFMGQLQQGVSRVNVALEIQSSAEARAVEVARWYRDGFGDTLPLSQLESDPSVIGWSNLLATNSPNTVLAGLLSTDYYYQALGGNNTAYVTGLYQALLGRTLDAGGLSNFLGELQQGASRFSVVQQLESSAEAKQTKVARWFQDEYGWTQSLGALKANATVDGWAALLGNS